MYIFDMTFKKVTWDLTKISEHLIETYRKTFYQKIESEILGKFGNEVQKLMT